jgi:hypothetical protein
MDKTCEIHTNGARARRRKGQRGEQSLAVPWQTWRSDRAPGHGKEKEPRSRPWGACLAGCLVGTLQLPGEIDS